MQLARCRDSGDPGTGVARADHVFPTRFCLFLHLHGSDSAEEAGLFALKILSDRWISSGGRGAPEA